MSIEPAFLVLLAISGPVIGVFLNVVIVRVPAGQSVIHPRPGCTHCEGAIGLRDSIPVLSWVVLRGRCRRCGASISAGRPLVEWANGVLWVAAGVRFGPHLIVVPYLALFSVLLVLAVIDLELYILPNKITYPAILVSLGLIPLLSAVLGHPGWATRALIGGAGYFLFLFIPALIYPKGMGFGDVKMAGLMGLYLGWIHPVLALLSLVIASVIGLVAGLVVLLVRRGKSRPYPFGPWLALGCVLAILASKPLLATYGY